VTNQETILKKAHIRLMRHPETCLYSGVLLLGDSTVVEDATQCPTAYTDGKNKRYGKAFLETLSVEEVAGLVLHENLHVLLKHIIRHTDLSKEDPRLANVAMDFVVNDIIVNLKDKALAKLPKGGLYDPKYHNWSVREVYNDLKKQGKGGSGGGGMKPLDEHDHEAAQKLSEAEAKELSKQITEAIQQGAMLAGKFGTSVPSVIADLMTPRVNWREALHEFVNSATRGRDDYTWRRLNRRRLADDMYMPSVHSEKVGEIVVAIDTSGSISGEAITEFATELVSICDVVNPDRVRVLWWDTQVHGEQIFEENYSGLTKMLKPMGGGGTRVSCVSEFLNNNSYAPDCVIVFTDGYLESDINWETDIPTLWMLTRRKDIKVKGQVVRMD